MTNDFDGLRTAALAVASSYDELSAQTTGRPWTNQEFALGLMGDIGDLAKIVMTLEGTLNRPDFRSYGEACPAGARLADSGSA